MGTTVGELAEKIGVSKSSVVRAIDELDLRGTGHVSRIDKRGTLAVDAQGASAIADRLKDVASPSTPRSEASRGATPSTGEARGIYRDYIDALRDRLKKADAQLEAKDEQIERLQSQLSAQLETIDGLRGQVEELSRRSWFERVFGRALPAPHG